MQWPVTSGQWSADEREEWLINTLMIIGNLTRDPELRATKDGTQVCTFTVAVNRKISRGTAEQTDYFRVTAWRGLAESCAKYLQKGRKVYVSGPVTQSSYQGRDGQMHGTMEVTANEVEFLSGTPNSDRPAVQDKAPDTNKGFVEVTEGDLPF